MMINQVYSRVLGVKNRLGILAAIDLFKSAYYGKRGKVWN